MPVTFWTKRRIAPTTRRQKSSRTPPTAARAEAMGIRVSGPRYMPVKTAQWWESDACGRRENLGIAGSRSNETRASGVPGTDPGLLQVDEAVLQELPAVAQHIGADLLVGSVELSGQGGDRRAHAAGVPQDIEEATAHLVHSVVVPGLDVEEHGLGRERPMDDVVRDHRPQRPDLLPFKDGFQHFSSSTPGADTILRWANSKICA